MADRKKIMAVAQDVIAGDYGSGDTRKKNLEAKGYNYSEVQDEVNRLLRYTGNGLITAPKKSIEQLAYEVIDGVWYSGDVRKTALTQAGYDYNAIQAKVNDILNPKKTIDELAHEVLEGKWGSGDERKRRLTEAGYDY